MKSLVFFLMTFICPTFLLMSQTPDESDISYGALDSEKLDYWRAAHEKSPVVLLIPGKDWSSAEKNNTEWVNAASLFQENGYAVVSINYVLSSDPAYSGYPQQPDNLASAIEWTKEHAHLLNGDPNRIFLLGSSAGAHLASLHALHPRMNTENSGNNNTTDPTVAAVIGLSGVYDFDLIPKNSISKSAIMSMLRDSTAYWKEAQPIEALSDKRETRFLVLHGTRDAFAGNSQPKAFYDHLIKNSYVAEMDILENRENDLLNDLSDPESWTTKRVLGFIESISRELAPQEPTGLLKAGDPSMLSVYPNPAKAELNISLEPDSYQYAELILTGIEGREIFHTPRQHQDRFMLQVENYPPGIYILSILTDRDQHQKKILIR